MENTNNKTETRLRKDLIETFEQVKKSVRRTEKRSRAGLMLGLQEMGSTLSGFIGGYYPVDSNIIVLNRTPLRRIEETDLLLLKPYAFHVMLHEYIHSLGLLDEEATRRKTYDVSVACFGVDHIITQLSTDMTKFFPNLVYPVYGWNPPQQPAPVEIIRGFDRSNTQQYIA